MNDLIAANKRRTFFLLFGFVVITLLVGVAVVGAEAGGQHPAFFLREMFHRVVDECAVQRQLLIRRGGQ